MKLKYKHPSTNTEEKFKPRQYTYISHIKQLQLIEVNANILIPA